MRRIGIIAVFAWLGCSSQEGPQIVLSNATVELDAFSGRPNPRWPLSVQEARDLGVRLSGLEPARGAQLPEGGLGYRGFFVDHGGGQRIFITGGLIAFMRGEQPPALYRDMHGAEAVLQAQARTRGLGGVFDR